jgi:hypothetical protein
MGFFSFLKYTFIIFAAHRLRITAIGYGRPVQRGACDILSWRPILLCLLNLNFKEKNISE